MQKSRETVITIVSPSYAYYVPLYERIGPNTLWNTRGISDPIFFISTGEMNFMTQTQGNQKILGAVSGVTLVLFWTMLTLHLESTTISFHQNAFHNPLLAWINLGPVPLFIGSGFYYFMRSDWSDAKKQQQFSALKGITAGFFLWIVVILIQPLQIYSNYQIYPILGGYLLMIVLALAFQGKFRLSES